MVAVKIWISLLAVCLFNFAYAEGKMTNLEIVQSTYQGESAAENGRNLERHLAADVRWTEAAGFPYAGTYVGYDAIVEHVFKRLAAEWVNYTFTVEDYVASADKVVAYGTYTGTYKPTNRYFEARVAHLWKLSGGKIVSFEQFVDSKVVADSM